VTVIADRRDNRAIEKVAKQDAITNMLHATVQVMGEELPTDAIILMVGDLMFLPLETVAAALRRCRQELKGRLTLKDILDRAEVVRGEGREQAEMVLAWDFARCFAQRHVRNRAGTEGVYEI
jgi:hypothetical protein